MYQCKVCAKEYENKYSFLGHCSSHHRDEFYKTGRSNRKKAHNYEHRCKYCGLEFSNGNNLGGHIVNCKQNPKYSEIRENRNIGFAVRMKSYKHSVETKKKISIAARLAIENGKLIKAGRCKKFKYNSPLSGEFTVDGTWELAFCKWADINNISVQRVGLQFEYIKPDGRCGWYHPDFKIDNYYIEIKGYETDLDRCKWSQFKYNLIILSKTEISKLNDFTSIDDLLQFNYKILSFNGRTSSF